MPLAELDQLREGWVLVGEDLLQDCSRYRVVKGRLGGNRGDFGETGLDAFLPTQSMGRYEEIYCKIYEDISKEKI